MHDLLLLGALALAGAQPATEPTTRSDDNVDWLLGQGVSTGAPSDADKPASRPATNPFGRKNDWGARKGTIVFSDGEKVKAMISSTADKPIRVWDEEKQEYRDIPFAVIKSMDAHVVWERDEQEWHFKESGSDIKEYSGKSYPARMTQYTVTLLNGQTITGDVAAPLYVETDSGPKTVILHKRDKGDVGQSLKQLVYITHVEFEE
jgi:hypothetical protein